VNVCAVLCLLQSIVSRVISLTRDAASQPAAQYIHRDLPGRSTDAPPPPPPPSTQRDDARLLGITSQPALRRPSLPPIEYSRHHDDHRDSPTRSGQGQVSRSRRVPRGSGNRVQPVDSDDIGDADKQERRRHKCRRKNCQRHHHGQQQTEEESSFVTASPSSELQLTV